MQAANEVKEEEEVPTRASLVESSTSVEEIAASDDAAAVATYTANVAIQKEVCFLKLAVSQHVSSWSVCLTNA
jgi:hypothetical protein